MCGSQTPAQYSKPGRTRVSYAVCFISREQLCRFLLRNPSFWFALWKILSMCSLNLVSQDRWTPRYLWVSVAWMFTLFKVYWNSVGEWERVKDISLHLSGRNIISHFSAHRPRASRSFWRSLESSADLIALYMRLSSA